MSLPFYHGMVTVQYIYLFFAFAPCMQKRVCLANVMRLARRIGLIEEGGGHAVIGLGDEHVIKSVTLPNKLL